MASATEATHAREHWGSRVGLILAMAGNAVGLGNFLRFPVQAANNGGGTFMIPYFISFILLGIPLMWMEWGVGRYGGRFGFATLPRMFDRLWRNPIAKYLGVLGIIMPLIVFIYYTVVVGWLLGFSFFSLTGAYFGEGATGVADYLASFQNIREGSGGWVGFLFFGIVLAVIVSVLSRGISKGIEKLALFGMPILFLFGLVIMIRVLTLPETAVGSPGEGLALLWTPEWSALNDASIWLAAAGQVFFTLSLGMGSIHAYASYLSEDDDITLTGLTTASTNEFAEVILGGTIAIPAAVTFFGISGLAAVSGTYDLGIVAMGVVFQNLPGGLIWGQLLAFMWFFLLFIAGITSSVALATPAMAFLQEEFGIQRATVAKILGGLALLLGFANIWWLAGGFLDEWDYWAGTFGLVVVAFIEVMIVRFAFGIDNFWVELHHGADLRVSNVFKFILTWVTPLFLTLLLGWWGYTEALPKLMMDGVASDVERSTRWLSRGFMAALVITVLVLIHRAWQRNPGVSIPPSDTREDFEVAR
ncbi:MAG: sodium:calcium symporter [Gemmatimonas sp.]|nr:sodium:calcium symporter [Gemmatimonas sp.]